MSALDELKKNFYDLENETSTAMDWAIVRLDKIYDGKNRNFIVDAAEELAALRAESERLKAVEEAAKKLSQLLPVYEIELARDVWGNTNTRIISDAAKVLAAALRGEA